MSKGNENPFAAFDLNKMFADLKLPGFDAAAIAAAQQKNLDAVAEANKRALEGYQALAKRQAEIFRENLNEMAEMMKTASSSPEANATKQAELIRQTIEKSLAHMRELTEMASKTNSEAYHALNQRMNETLEEFKSSFGKAKK